MTARFQVIIPARLHSTRLPRKVLADICGRPLLQHVYERARESGAESIIVATDDEAVATVARGFGAHVEMTSTAHASGTDRVAEVASRLGPPDTQIVVNLQGDEPLMPGNAIAQVAALLDGDVDAAMATLCERITEQRDIFDANVVKIVVNAAGDALYFSRAPVPWQRESFDPGASRHWPLEQPYFRHIGIYAYRVGFLRRLSALPPADLERSERLEQLRALHIGARIRVAEACAATGFGVDTLADLERVRQRLCAGRAHDR